MPETDQEEVSALRLSLLLNLAHAWLKLAEAAGSSLQTVSTRHTIDGAVREAVTAQEPRHTRSPDWAGTGEPCFCGAWC